MNITPDQIVYWSRGFVQINATLLFTWAVMALLVVGSIVVTRRLTSGPDLGRAQNLLEVIVGEAREQIRDVARQDPDRYLPFAGTLFVFILVSNVLAVVPGFQAPTASLSTTAALAISVFVAVPAYGIAGKGIAGYLRHYIEPVPLMLPLNILGELSRTIALAIRLYGNMMSGAMIVGILLSVAPILFPVVMNLLGLITGVIQAYIFAVLAMVYIAAATRAREEKEEEKEENEEGEES